MFSAKDAQESQQQSKYINAGINEVRVTEVTGGTSQNGHPFLEFTFSNKEEGTIRNRFTLSEKAQKKAMGDMIHLAAAMGIEQEFRSITGNTIESYAAAIKKLIIAKGNPIFQAKFVRKLNLDGTKLYTQLAPWPPFAAPRGSDTLTYDAAKDSDVLVTTVQAPTPSFNTAPAESDDLPFDMAPQEAPSWM